MNRLAILCGLLLLGPAVMAQETTSAGWQLETAAGMSLDMRKMPDMPGMPMPQPPSGSLTAKVYVNGQENGAIKTGDAITLAFELIDASGQIIHDFNLDDTKYMHLIIVRDDHSTYAHVHPSLDAQTGRFSIQINQPSNDPDNQDAAAAIPKAGIYDLYAQVVPKGGQPQTIRLQLRTADADQARRVDQQLDGTLPDRRISKYIAISPESGQGFYGTTLGAMIMQGMAPTLSLHLESCRQAGGPCQPVTDLEPWLGMEGHAVIISQDGSVFRHWHAMTGNTGEMPMGPDLSFMAMDGDATLPSGDYNIWLTVKRQGQIAKLPYFVKISGTSAASR